MPRRKLARRFEPRGGVSQVMLDVESKWVQRELEDYLLSSINELKEKLAELQARVTAAEESLGSKLRALPDRERLALKCMLARDVYHIAMLYETFFRSSSTIEDATGTTAIALEELDEESEPRPVLIFKPSLFE